MRPIIAARGPASAEYADTTRVALTREGPPHRLDDAVLDWPLKIRVHRQADDFIGELFADWQAAIGHRKTAIGSLAMQRLGVIDRRRNALRFQCRTERVS